jgi:hypothetical protein
MLLLIFCPEISSKSHFREIANMGPKLKLDRSLTCNFMSPDLENTGSKKVRFLMRFSQDELDFS